MDFHPLVQDWFSARFGSPSPPQAAGWPVIQEGSHTLIAAPTGSGKTLAAFLSAIDQLVRVGLEKSLGDKTHILYVSPLKALANDIGINLLQPLEGIRTLGETRGTPIPEIRVAVRTGDTPASQRRKALDKPPHIFVTTPESLFILLATRRGRELLATVGSVIVDEIHSLARDKRGSHLALTLEFLERLRGKPIQRIGLSATQKPIERIGRFLGGDRPVRIVNVGHQREMDLNIEVPGVELAAVATHEIWEDVYDRLAGLVESHTTSLVFVNTRRLAERLCQQLSDRLGADRVAAHHGSLSKEIRLQAEQKLKNGQLKAVVATASLELGIDVGSVELVCQIGSTRSISLAMQRVGRSGHFLEGRPTGVFFPTTRDDLVETAALLFSMQQGELDAVRIPEGPLDVLAQHVVAASASEEWNEASLFQTVCRSFPYCRLERSDFDAVLAMLSEGISTRKGRVGSLLHRDRVNGKIRGRRGARILAVTSGGAIPENANYLVKADPDESIVGDLDEDFAVESSRGDIFLLGNTSWRIRRVESGVVRVEDAAGMPPTVPFWRGEAPGRTDELSSSLSRLREFVASHSANESRNHLERACGCSPAAAQQAVDYLRAGCQSLTGMPTRRRVVAERFFDEGGGMQLVLHAPFGSRINKAWGLALRKRFCRSFNFELQAAATDDGIVISLSDQHSFPLDTVFGFLSSAGVQSVLVQALLAVPLFGVRWRWTATRALQVRRFSGGRKVPPPLQRLRSDDLLAAVFPAQAACLEHIHGDIEVPDHPLVQETLRDCLTEAMDVEGLCRVLESMEKGEIECVSIDTREPSVFSHAILNANPYAFLDEAPLEERRTRAVLTRRSLLPEDAGDLGALDPQAITKVREEAWPLIRDVDELHDALLSLAIIEAPQLEDAGDFVGELLEQRRAATLDLGGKDPMIVASERLGLVLKAYPGLEPPDIWQDEHVRKAQWDRDSRLEEEQAVRELVRYRLECSGPLSAVDMSGTICLEQSKVEKALLALEAEGQILRGRFTPGKEGLEWCDRTLLARIHRLTLGKLRREIEPVSPADFMRFLFKWQKVAPGTGLHGQDGLNAVLEQLQGFEAPASGWEQALLPTRIPDYAPQYLDALCLSGHFMWGRLARPGGASETRFSGRAIRPSKVAPMTFLRRKHLHRLLALTGDIGADASSEGGPVLSHAALEIAEELKSCGALFFNDLVTFTGRLPVEVETGLWELVAAGVVTADGFATLRALIDPKQRRGGNRHAARKRLRQKNLSSGRWTLIRSPRALREEKEKGPQADLEWFAWLLLRRWGIVFRDLLKRENFAPAWRDLVRVYRRLELQGRIRSGRFVSGFAGEQFAAPEAVESLRNVRRSAGEGQICQVSAADPLNLIGIVLPGARIRPHPGTWILFKDGLFLEERATPEVPGRMRK